MDNNNSNNYINKTHTYGKIWTLVTLALFLSVPMLICAHLGVSPKLEMIGKGLATVALVFYPTAVLEVITYSPMLGTGGTYLGFVTGNITNLKLPVALNAMESAEVEPGSEEGEVISTISIAVSALRLHRHFSRLRLRFLALFVRHILQNIGKYQSCRL